MQKTSIRFIFNGAKYAGTVPQVVFNYVFSGPDLNPKDPTTIPPLPPYLFASDLAVLDDGRGRGVDAQHGVVVVGVVLRVRLIGRHYGYRCEIEKEKKKVIQWFPPIRSILLRSPGK